MVGVGIDMYFLPISEDEIAKTANDTDVGAGRDANQGLAPAPHIRVIDQSEQHCRARL